MNYLAHLELAQPNSASRTGNLMGDFMKGVRLHELPIPLSKGILNHRAVDKWVDQHPAFLACKPLFGPRYRRFAGIMLDVSFDYFLTKHWQQFHGQPRQAFIQSCYTDLLKERQWMNTRMHNVVEQMAKNNWLEQYQDFAHVGFVLDRIALQLRFNNHFTDSINVLLPHYDTLESLFLTIYPGLQQYVRQQSLEVDNDDSTV